MDGDQPVRVANVQFGEKSAAILVYYKIDGIVNARVRQRKLVTGDAVVDALAGRMRLVDDQTPSARAAAFGNNSEATDVQGGKGWCGEGARYPPEMDLPCEIIVDDLRVAKG